MASTTEVLTYFAPIAGLLGLFYAGMVHQSISSIRVRGPALLDLSGILRESIARHRQREIPRLTLVLLGVISFLYWALGPLAAFTAFIGALASLLARVAGWRSALRATIRTAVLAREPDSPDALAVALAGGWVLALSCLGLALVGLGSTWLIPTQLPACAAGFLLGAACSSIAVRPGPELQGLGWIISDRFESWCAALVATFALGDVPGARAAIPLAIATAALIAVLAASRAGTGRARGLPESRLRRTILSAAALHLSAASAAILLLAWPSWNLVLAHGGGVLGALLLAALAELRSSGTYLEVQRVAEALRSGPAVAIPAGLEAGLRHALAPFLLLASVVLFADSQAGAYGIGLAALGMTAVLGLVHGIETLGTTVLGSVSEAASAEHPEDSGGILASLLPASRSASAAGRDVALGVATLAALALYLAFLKSGDLSPLAPGSPGFWMFLPLGSALAWYLAVSSSRLLCFLIPLAVGLYSFEALAGLLAGILLSAGPLAFVASGCVSVWQGSAAQVVPSEATRTAEALAARLLESTIPSLSSLLKLGAATAWFLALAQGN